VVRGGGWGSDLGMELGTRPIYNCTKMTALRRGLTWEIFRRTCAAGLLEPLPIIVYSCRWLIIDPILVTFGQTKFLI